MPLAKRPLGTLGAVSVQGLGCMGLTWAYSSALEGTVEAKEAFVRTAHDAGVTLFNSANIYGGGPHGGNEELLGRALRGRPRDSFFIATKFGIKLPDFVPDLRASAVRASCLDALARLQLDSIDLFIVCRQDTSTPLEETMRELKALVEEGKVRGVGLSEASAAQIRRAHAVLPLTAVEVEYSLWCRDIEAAILPTCRELGISILAYSPLGRGFLSGKYAAHADVAVPGPFFGRDYRSATRASQRSRLRQTRRSWTTSPHWRRPRDAPRRRSRSPGCMRRAMTCSPYLALRRWRTWRRTWRPRQSRSARPS